jgi:dethiobiotin synthetase
MSQPIFITGIGTGVGKTLAAAIVTEALGGDYWKPIQAGIADGTDSQWVAERLEKGRVLPEVHRLQMPASPHIAAREEGKELNLDQLLEAYHALPRSGSPLIIEGAGGLMVPLNDRFFIADWIKALQAKVVIVSRNYLGSINHSLLTVMAAKQYQLDVAGWLFNDQYLDYEGEIIAWTGLPALGSIPFSDNPDRTFVLKQASILRSSLNAIR